MTCKPNSAARSNVGAVGQATDMRYVNFHICLWLPAKACYYVNPNQ